LLGDANSGPFSAIFSGRSGACFHNLCELDLFVRISAHFDSITIAAPWLFPIPINFRLINGRQHDM